MTAPGAKVIADSVSPAGSRITTIELTLHRFVLAEMNTHRTKASNAASSRAIPFPRMSQRVLDDPAVPVVWASEQRGMAGGDEIEFPDTAEGVWLRAARQMVAAAQDLHELGVHKSIANRLLEPFAWATVIFTADRAGWSNFLAQRDPRNPDASPPQPEMQVVAAAARVALEESTPLPVQLGGWHLPYVSTVERERFSETVCRRLSTARCARVSYLTHDGRYDPEADLGLFERLMSANPKHSSPAEHQARPMYHDEQQVGCLHGWRQHRHLIEQHANNGSKGEA